MWRCISMSCFLVSYHFAVQFGIQFSHVFKCFNDHVGLISGRPWMWGPLCFPPPSLSLLTPSFSPRLPPPLLTSFHCFTLKRARFLSEIDELYSFINVLLLRNFSKGKRVPDLFVFRSSISTHWALSLSPSCCVSIFLLSPHLSPSFPPSHPCIWSFRFCCHSASYILSTIFFSFYDSGY